MSEPSLVLQGAILAALQNSAPVTALIGQRVYDQVPPLPQFPYVRIGDDQVIADHAECLEGSVEIFCNLHVWSRAVGKVEAKRIAGAIVTLLNAAPLSLSGYRLVLLEHRSSQAFDDPDGITTHCVVTFRALIDEV